MQALAGQQHACPHQFRIELPHFGKQLFAGHDSGLAIVVSLDEHHESHIGLLA
jgi:hypothetical protein